ncbi:MAG: hypothetical protein AAGF26_14865, partial [Cyanobacteria bacterium P01_G01_bin.49]
ARCCYQVKSIDNWVHRRIFNNLFRLKRHCFLWFYSISETLDNLSYLKIMKDSSMNPVIYRLYLVTTSREDIDLSFFPTENEAVEIANKIQVFLGLNHVLRYDS